ncbi:hypothetical protein BEH_07840 [Priestia filamentosa]|uniref:Uncharacterized protein n=1 Tax=Priestia filamentosa TaxID=1402861 RepID=A0A0H4KEI0_9BACI|nr:hypothetical protein [Priestia filamentosa]AKO92020.1 hypothetical protein BEH_07840 [Priestia filamentosa]
MTNNKPQTFGTFEAKGTITVDPNTFQIDLKGKNNPQWNYSRLNMKMEDNEGNSFYLNAQDGFSLTDGRIIYANLKDGEANEQLQVAFGDRNNPEILKHVADRSFIKVALRKVKNEEGKMVWDYVNFLTAYDVMNYLKDRLKTGMKLYVRGRVKHSIFNDKLQREYEIQRIFLLPAEEESDSGFKFTQSVLISSNSLDLEKWETEGIATVNTKLHYKKKGVSEYLDLELKIRATEENKGTYQKIIDKYLTVEEDKIRQITVDGKYKIGYTQRQVTKEDLPAEALELIEDGFYTLEEVLKMNTNNGERVDEMQLTRPTLLKDRDTGKPKLIIDDEAFKPEDLIMVDVEPEPEVVVSNDDDEDLSFLDDLD